MLANTWDGTIAGRTVVVVGLGRSGEAAARLALRKGAARVVIQDRKSADDLGADRVRALSREGLVLSLGGHDAAELSSAGLVVLSPGVPDFDALVAAERGGTPVVSEIEFASRFVRGRWLGITGTNGKSTVTTLVGEMLRAQFGTAFVGGNLGTPFAEGLDGEDGGSGRFVLELSSYQLERTFTLRCDVACCLNLTPDHLDRYGTMARYGAAKQRLFSMQRRGDHAVVPGFDPLMLAMAAAGPASVLRYGVADGECRVENGAIVCDGARYPLSMLRIRGGHNVENAMAAVLCAAAFGVRSAAIERVLGSFPGLPHRMQFVLEHGGVQFFDDSKATNVGSTLKALEGCDRPTVLILGGRDKGGSYEPLRAPLTQKGRGMVLLGEARPIIEQALGGVVPHVSVGTMDEAVDAAFAMARPGDAVLLAPACSSLDMYENYAARGRHFAEAAQRIATRG